MKSYLMVTDTTTKPIVDGVGPSQKPSDILANYERLLRVHTDRLRKDEFNPYQSYPMQLLRTFSPAHQFRLWKNVAPFFKVPNTLRQPSAEP